MTRCSCGEATTCSLRQKELVLFHSTVVHKTSSQAGRVNAVWMLHFVWRKGHYEMQVQWPESLGLCVGLLLKNFSYFPGYLKPSFELQVFLVEIWRESRQGFDMITFTNRQYIEQHNRQKQYMEQQKSLIRKRADRAPSWRGIPWHLPYNWGKSTENPQSG